MTGSNDRDLRERFQALRREDADAAPPFRATLTAARGRHATPARRRGLGLAAVAVVVTSVALAVLISRPDRHAVSIDLSTVRWEAPTDFLLALPDDELLRSVPELGRVSVSGVGFTNINADRRTP